MFTTRFTEFLGVRYPIQCGAMMHITDAAFTAAAANAGIFCCLASAMFQSEGELTDELKKLKDLTDKPFGVNVSLFPGHLPLSVESCLDLLAKFEISIVETAGRSPEPYVQKIKKRGFRHIHKCARVRDAVKVSSLGVDMVGVVGAECGGHPSMEMVTSLVMIPEVRAAIDKPLIAGGGFCDGKGLVAALALGADAVLMGTRFLCTTECRAHSAVKEKLLQAKETDTLLIQKSIGSMRRVLKNDWAEKVTEMEEQGASLEELMPYISGKRAGERWVSGGDDAVFSCGQVVGRIKEVISIKELVTGIMTEAAETVDKLAGMRKQP